MRNTLGQLTTHRLAEPPQAPGQPLAMTGRVKAAVIVRLLLAEGASLPLSSLPEHMQAALTEQIGRMRLVDRTTLEEDRLLPVLEEESEEVAAVMLSKLPIPKAASLLGRLPGDKARRVAYAVSQTGNVDPETVRRIGQSLAAQLDTQPARAFETGPVERVGAILNVTAAATRDEVLKGLDETDAEFARKVRRAIFTFVHLPHRIAGRDVPKVVRVVDQAVLVTAIAGATTDELGAAATFLLENLSQRLAQSIRDEVAERGAVREKDAEEAQGAIITAIRELEATGELAFVVPAED